MRQIQLLLLSSVCAAGAQVTLQQAVEQATQQYPAVRAAMERTSAAAAGIRLARTSYLPRADFLAQLNRATHNNVFGMLLQQPVISPISGPALPLSANSVWGTATGVLVSWEPVDFGLRKANVVIAEKERKRTEADTGWTRLQVGAAAADAFLTVLAAEQTVAAAKAGVERARVLNQSVAALVQADLRPGVEASRTRAELAVAETQLARAEQAAGEARAGLSQFLDAPPAGLELAAGSLLARLPVEETPAAQPDAHPLAAVQTAAIDEVKARQHALDRSYYPKFNLQATAYGRGTGIQPDLGPGGAASGLGPNHGNWAVGMTVLFNASDLASLRARKEIESAREREETARYRQVVKDLSSQAARARAAIDGARKVAANTPAQLAAARATEQQASARYKAGLGVITEVAEAQRLLVQAEIDDALAKLGVWRALLQVAAAQGDLTTLLAQAR
ncbi:MAG: TolC family protein [Bryobacteraceae bacterium]